MSGFGGFGGFGQTNNNNNQTSGFGTGFGQTTPSTGGFGSTNTTGGFGSNNTQTGGIFGSSTPASTGFGGTSTGFGSGGFGAKPNTPAFGASNTANTGSGIFGSGGNSGFGGAFGGNTASATPAFGSSNTGGLFGAKTATSAFGSGAPTSSPFGNTTNAFGANPGGASQATALSANIGECPGTGVAPFAAFEEKEGASMSSLTAHYQNVCFQAPYQKFSPEELRLVDYQKGQKYGQQGGFGTATNFGGFGNTSNNTTGFGAAPSTGTGLFGANNNNAGTSAFGQQPATNAFGSTGGLFGQKPAATGFGATPTPSTNLFGSTNNTGGGFGGANTNAFGSNNNTGGMFGSTNNNNKPATGGFGFGTQPAATGNTGFGSTNTGGIFGNTPAQGTNNTTPSNNLFGGFGNNNNQQQTNSAPSLFGAPKPTGLFGSTTTPSTSGTGLFGGTSTPAATGFGTSGGTGLFGSNPKPAATSNLFGGPNTNTATPQTTGLFGGLNNNQQQQQQQQTPGLFGATQQKPGGLFGSTPQTNGSSLFNNSANSNGLFGQSNQQQQQPAQANTGLFGGNNSMLGNSQQSQPQSLTASINDNAAFGTASLFQNLGSSTASNPGPIATPLTGVSKPKKNPQMPLYRLHPASSSRFSTPSKNGLGSYGYSYSTSSSTATSSSSTPLNFSQSLLGNSLNRSLVKSMSASSLSRRYTSAEESVLAPGAFTASTSSRHSGGNVKKLTINPSVRNTLFTPPKETGQNGQSGKKNVRFNDLTNGSNPSPLKNVQSSSSSPTPQELGLLRSSTNDKTRAEPAPEMQQVRGNEVAIITEKEDASSPAAPRRTTQTATNTKGAPHQQPGEYWCEPTIEELQQMNRNQLQKISDFRVGRVGAGEVTFKGLVNLSDIKLDELLGGLITIRERSITVYANQAVTPPVGKGLNVPSIIILHSVWPKKSGTPHSKHVARLKALDTTKFISWDPVTGDWTFEVEHYTTYGLDEDDEDEDELVADAAPMDSMDFGESTLSAPPDTPTPRRQTPREHDQEDSYMSQMTATDTTDSNIDDTFEFRTRKNLPGAFDNQGIYEEDEDEMDGEYLNEDQSFLARRSVGSQSDVGNEDSTMQDTIYDDESVVASEREVAGSFFSDDDTTGRGEFHEPSYDADMKLLVPDTPALMRERLRETNTPLKSTITAGDDWMKSLQGSISPRKQDRRLLKQRLANELEDINDESEEETPMTNRASIRSGMGIATSIDLMNSIFGHTKSPMKQARSPKKSPRKPSGFARPYSKVPSAIDEGAMSEQDRAFHDSLKPSWGPDGLLVYAAPPYANAFGKSGRAIRGKDGLLEIQGIFNISETRDIRFAKFSYEDSVKSMQTQKSVTTISSTKQGIPFAKIVQPFKYTDFSENINARNPAAAQEKLVWELAAALLDPIDTPKDLKHIPNIDERLRKECVSNFWQKLVDATSSRNAAMVKTSEEKAIACLSGHKIIEACNHLLNGENYHLATLVALLGSQSDATRQDIKDQLQIWNSTSPILPDIDPSIRAVYEILAGNVCACHGKEKGFPEDCFKPFCISTKFGLDWRQAFGMRLWYAISAEQPIEEAVKMFATDLSQNSEPQKPHPWYVEQGVEPLWSDDGRQDREDLLWGLLKLYSNPQTEDLQSILRPENSQLSPLDVRLSWQLGRALIATGDFTYGTDADEKQDTLTLSFANQLTAQGDWLDATFVLLHLSSEGARAKAIKDHISRQAGNIGDESDAEFQTLIKELMVPASWVWEAKALYMRSVKKSSRKEVECLLKAGSWESAHKVFSTEVAPEAIIERDHNALKKLLRGFEGKETKIEGWHLGGELYSDYIALVEGQKINPNHPDPKMIDRLLAALPAVTNKTSSMMETVAVQEIGGVVAKIVLASQSLKRERSKILRLPLTEDKHLQHTVDLALNYYRNAMAVAK